MLCKACKEPTDETALDERRYVPLSSVKTVVFGVVPTDTQLMSVKFQRNGDWWTSIFWRDHREYSRSLGVTGKQKNAD
jgi:hypothetical protein